MKTRAIAIVLCLVVSSLALAATPLNLDEVKRSAVFIGIVEVADLPEAPAGGFTAAKPPIVTVKILEIWRAKGEGAGEGETRGYYWSDFQLAETTEADDPMRPDLTRIGITPPAKGERFVVFAQPWTEGVWSDVPGWRRKVMIEDRPHDNAGPDAAVVWSDLTDHCLARAPLTEIPYTADIYSRRAFTIKTAPDNPLTRAAAMSTSITETGDYWLVTEYSAMKMSVTSIEKNPDWPATYAVKPGDTLAGIAKKFYGTETQWKVIQKANGIANPERLKVGMVLTIPAQE